MRRWKGVLLGAGLCAACGLTADESKPLSPTEEPSPPPATHSPNTPPENSTRPPAEGTDGNGSRPPRRPVSFYAGVAPEGIAVGDFNEDGAPDVAIHAGGRNLSSDYARREGEFLVLLNDGTGKLAATAAPLRERGLGGHLLAKDLDGDGHLDLLLGSHDGAWPLFGAGDGSFSRKPTRFFAGGDIASMGFLSLGSGAPAFWSMGNYGGHGAGRPLASFSLMRLEGPGIWNGTEVQVLDDRFGRPDTQRFMGLTDSGQAPVVADFNEDNLPDVVTNQTEERKGNATLLLGTRWGLLQPSGFLPRERSFLRVFAADFNRDGHMDVLGLTTLSLEVYLGDGHGRFAGGGTWPLEVAAQNAAVVDFDADGFADVVAFHPGTSEVSLLHGQGDGTLLPYGRLRVGRHPSAVALVDLDRNGALELLVAESDDNTVSAYAVPPGPMPAPPPFIACPLMPRTGDSILEVSPPPLASLQVGPVATTSRLQVRSLQAVGDFDGDGRKDLALAQQGAVRLVLQPTPGTFVTRDVPDTSRVLGVSAGDLDGDGRTDLAVTVAPESWGYPWEGFLSAALLWNDAEGLFRERTSYPEGRHDPLVADLDGDGRMELAMTHTAGCPGPLIRFTQTGARTFREDRLTNYNTESDDRCPDLGAPLAGDFNGDGTLDLLHTTLGININPTSREGASLPGHGFESTVRFGRESWAVDADADGHLDVVHQGSRSQLLLYRGDGHATLGAPRVCALPTEGRVFAYEDVNGDGLADVVGESPEGQGLWVGLGTGGGRWRTLHYALSGPVEWARGVDLLGDSRPELVVLLRSGELRVLPTPEP